MYENSPLFFLHPYPTSPPPLPKFRQSVFLSASIHLLTASSPCCMQMKRLAPLSSSPPRSLVRSSPHSSAFLEFKKSYENDSQSSDNVNFLRVGWSNKQLTTLKPLLSEIEYLQDQHLLLTVKSVDGYESYGRSRALRC